MGAEIVRQSNTLTFNDAKLQTLDRRVGADQLVFDRDMFAQSLSEWEDIPVIYHSKGKHPTDFEAVNKNPDEAAKKMGGRLVGRVHNPRIVIEGGARLMASLTIDSNEREIADLWQKGLLFPSTAFSVMSDGDRITSPPVPNHVLIFPMEVDTVIPGDPGAYLNTLEVNESMTESEKEMADVQELQSDGKKMSFYEWIEQTVDKILSKRKNAEKPKEDTSDDSVEGDDMEEKKEESQTAVVEDESKKVTESVVEPVSEVGGEGEVTNSSNLSEQDVHEVGAEGEITNSANLSAEETTESDAPVEMVHSEEIKSLQTEIASLKEEIAQMNSIKEELEQYKQAEKDREFSEFVNSLPFGMKPRSEEERADLRVKYDTDAKSLLHTVLEQMNTNCTTEKVNEQFTQSAVTEPNPNVNVTVGDLTKLGN